MHQGLNTKIMGKTIFKLLQSSGAWDLSLNHPNNATALACLLATPQTCADNQVLGPISVVDPTFQGGGGLVGQALLADNTNPSFGYNPEGLPCTSFDGQDGDGQCPSRIDVFVRTLADPSNPGQFNVKIEPQGLVYDGRSLVRLSSRRHGDRRAIHDNNNPDNQLLWL